MPEAKAAGGGGEASSPTPRGTGTKPQAAKTEGEGSVNKPWGVLVRADQAVDRNGEWRRLGHHDVS
jgi:hypothetical protein